MQNLGVNSDLCSESLIKIQFKYRIKERQPVDHELDHSVSDGNVYVQNT